MTAAAKVVKGDLAYNGRVIIYILKGTCNRMLWSWQMLRDVEADQTNYINYIKPLILAEELHIDYIISIIDTKAQWYYQIHPERYVPALKDWCSKTEKETVVFESTACLQYLADQYDAEGYWSGRNAAEKAAVLSWTAYQTAGLG